MEEERTRAVVERAESALGAPVLLAGVGAREAKHSAVGGEEGANSKVVELAAVVGLEGEDGVLELCLYIRIKRNKCGKNIRFMTQGKGQDIVT